MSDVDYDGVALAVAKCVAAWEEAIQQGDYGLAEWASNDVFSEGVQFAYNERFLAILRARWEAQGLKDPPVSISPKLVADFFASIASVLAEQSGGRPIFAVP